MVLVETYKVWVMGADGQCVQIDMPLIESKIVYRPNTGLKNEEPQNIEVGYKFAEVTRIFNDHWICKLRRRCNIRQSCMDKYPCTLWPRLLKKGYRRLRK